MQQASSRVVSFAGGAWDASLNLYSTGGNCLVATQQVDEWVYVVGQDSFEVARYSLSEWLGEDETDPPLIECDDEQMAWELLRLLRQVCLLWQCGGGSSPPAGHGSMPLPEGYMGVVYSCGWCDS
jgi:hypothetical protein